jgi:hypothetical protein
LVRKLPQVGWIITDPVVARRLLTDSEHTSLLGEGGVGHLWAQLLGEWVNTSFDGPGHDMLRRQARDLFTDASARRHVARVFAEPATRLTDALRRNETVDIAETARVWVGRMVADLLGLSIANDGDDAAFRSIFAQGERLAALARGTLSSTVIPKDILAEAREILEHITAKVPEAYETADKNALLGRCREAGIPLREARGLAEEGRIQCGAVAPGGGGDVEAEQPGERLPPAKDLAAVLGVNTNTVLRALRVLRDEGLLEFRRGRGISVAGTPERGAVVQRARELVVFARSQGYRVDELVEIIEEVG